MTTHITTQKELFELRRQADQAQDLAWESWIQDPQAIMEILKDPDLAVRPSQRPLDSTRLTRLLQHIRARQQSTPKKGQQNGNI